MNEEPQERDKGRLVELAIRDYELKAEYLIKHYERMWTRFSYLTGLELALFIGVGFAIKEDITWLVVVLMSAIGLLLSLIWFIVTFEDRKQVVEYRSHIGEAYETLQSLFGHPPELEGSKYVGMSVGATFEGISITRFPIWVAGGFCLVWLIALSLTVPGFV